MGREIRRVPLDWQHPKSTKHAGYQPLHDKTFAEAQAEWEREREAFVKQRPTDYKGELYMGTFEEWHGSAPDPLYYRPDFGDRATAYQMYETVTEGTPVSPVFATEAEMVAWLIGKGHTEKAARAFVAAKWAPSMIACGGKIAMNVDTYDMMPGTGPAVESVKDR